MLTVSCKPQVAFRDSSGSQTLSELDFFFFESGLLSVDALTLRWPCLKTKTKGGRARAEA